MDIHTELEIGITERGNNAFSNEEGNAVLFAMVGDNQWLQSMYCPQNYPVWNVTLITCTKEAMIDHIGEHLGGWRIDKCQFDINQDCGIVVSDEEVIEDVVTHVLNKLYDWDFDPLATVGALEAAVADSATELDYKLTSSLRIKCYSLITAKIENNS